MSRASQQALLITIIVVGTIILVLFMLMGRPAHALECQSEPQHGTYWSWRQIDGRKCWYQGHKVLPKSDLHWREAKPKEPPPLPTKPMPAPPPRAEIKYPCGAEQCTSQSRSIDSSFLNTAPSTTWPLILDVDALQSQAKAEPEDPPDECCWPSAEELRSFEDRWKDVPTK